MLFQFFLVITIFDIFSAFEVGGIKFPKDCLKKNRALFLDELEPTLTADYLFQYEVFDIHTHDEIEQSTERHKKTQRVLLHLENKSNQCFSIFIQVLKISKQEFILDMLEKRENKKHIMPKG